MTSRFDNIRALASVADIAVIAVLAFASYLALAHLVIDKWQIMPPTRARTVGIKVFLDDQATRPDDNAVHVMGSSVVVEGLDCDVVDAELGDGAVSYNLAWTNSGPRKWMLMAPSVVAAKPAVVVVCADLNTMTHTSETPVDLLAIAGYWGFLHDRDLSAFASVFDDRERGVLTAPAVTQLLTLRSLPPAALDSYVREVSRPSLRFEGYTANFKAPWVYRKIIPPPAMAAAMKRQVEAREGRTEQDIARPLAMLEALVAYLRGAGSRVVLVYTPIHPRLSAPPADVLIGQVRAGLRGLAERNNLTFLDHSGLLTVDQYSDALHPFGEGRRIWSEALGRALAEELQKRE